MHPVDSNKNHLGRPVIEKIPISAKGLFLQNDIYEQLKFAYAISPRNTVRAFRRVGIVISGPQDLAILANLHTSGQDVSGFTGRNGTIYAFNVREIINRKGDDPDRIKITNKMMESAPFYFTDAVIHRGKVKII